MQIQAKFEIDVLQLFVHDQWDTGPFDDDRVASILTQWLWDEGGYDMQRYRIEPPSDTGLDRFVLSEPEYEWQDGRFEPKRWTHRMRSKEDVRVQLPREVVKLLSRLDGEVVKL